MWKYFPRSIRESFERRVCFSNTDKSSTQKSNRTVLHTKFTPVLDIANTQQTEEGHQIKNKVPSRNEKHQAKGCLISNLLAGNSNLKCNISRAVLPSLPWYFCGSSKRQKCGWEKHRKGKQQESSWTSGTYIEHTWFSAVGWGSFFILGWIIQPLRYFWVHPYDRERKSNTGTHKLDHRIFGSTCGRSHQIKSDTCYENVLAAVYKTLAVHTLYVHPNVQIQGTDTTVIPQNAPFDFSVLDEKFNNVPFDLVQSDELQISDTSPDLLTFEGKEASLDFSQGERSPTSDVPDGTVTTTEAVDEAADKFLEFHNRVLGNIDNQLGVSYIQKGQYKEAIDLFTRAMEYHNAGATFNLGVCYEKGLGTGQDLKQAAKYYQLASDQGHATAMYNLGVFYVHGRGGLPVDCDQANQLFEKASALGQTDAKRALKLKEESNYSQTHTPPNMPEERKMIYDHSTPVFMQVLGKEIGQMHVAVN